MLFSILEMKVLVTVHSIKSSHQLVLRFCMLLPSRLDRRIRLYIDGIGRSHELKISHGMFDCLRMEIVCKNAIF